MLPAALFLLFSVPEIDRQAPAVDYYRISVADAVALGGTYVRAKIEIGTPGYTFLCNSVWGNFGATDSVERSIYVPEMIDRLIDEEADHQWVYGFLKVIQQKEGKQT